jgi:hypothetical protein
VLLQVLRKDSAQHVLRLLQSTQEEYGLSPQDFPELQPKLDRAIKEAQGLPSVPEE